MSTYGDYERDYYERVTKPRRQAASTHRRQAKLGPDVRALTIRLPGTLLADLRERAEANRRTLSAEIVARLTQNLTTDERHRIELPQ